MLALKGLTPSGQLPLGVLSQGKSGLSSGESEIVQRKQSLNALVSWVFVGEQVHVCGPCNHIIGVLGACSILGNDRRLFLRENCHHRVHKSLSTVVYQLYSPL